MILQWKAETDTATIGILELGNLTLIEDYMEIGIDILGMSGDLKAEVDKEIELVKQQYSEEVKANLEKRHPNKRGYIWSEKPVIMDYTFLQIQLETGKPVQYRIEFAFHDAVDDYMEAEGNVVVDLSAHEPDLKRILVHSIIDKFF